MNKKTFVIICAALGSIAGIIAIVDIFMVISYYNWSSKLSHAKEEVGQIAIDREAEPEEKLQPDFTEDIEDDIANENEMGMKYLEIIVSSLNKAGLLESIRGKNGGYKLNRKPKDYSIGEILHAAEGSLSLVSCVGDTTCENAGECKTYAMWKELDDKIENLLSKKTLEDII